jgi:hypothetical protein
VNARNSSGLLEGAFAFCVNWPENFHFMGDTTLIFWGKYRAKSLILCVRSFHVMRKSTLIDSKALAERGGFESPLRFQEINLFNSSTP